MTHDLISLKRTGPNRQQYNFSFTGRGLAVILQGLYNMKQYENICCITANSVIEFRYKQYTHNTDNTHTTHNTGVPHGERISNSTEPGDYRTENNK